MLIVTADWIAALLSLMSLVDVYCQYVADCIVDADVCCWCCFLTCVLCVADINRLCVSETLLLTLVLAALLMFTGAVRWCVLVRNVLMANNTDDFMLDCTVDDTILMYMLCVCVLWMRFWHTHTHTDELHGQCLYHFVRCWAYCWMRCCCSSFSAYCSCSMIAFIDSVFVLNFFLCVAGGFLLVFVRWCSLLVFADWWCYCLSCFAVDLLLTISINDACLTCLLLMLITHALLLYLLPICIVDLCRWFT